MADEPGARAREDLAEANRLTFQALDNLSNDQLGVLELVSVPLYIAVVFRRHQLELLRGAGSTPGRPVAVSGEFEPPDPRRRRG